MDSWRTGMSVPVFILETFGRTWLYGTDRIDLFFLVARPRRTRDQLAISAKIKQQRTYTVSVLGLVGCLQQTKTKKNIPNMDQKGILIF
jgi:hypothetical protein